MPELLALPAPEDASTSITLDVSTGQPVVLDHLGPVVVNSDGTLARIANWHEMSEREQQVTQRRIAKRNMERLQVLNRPADGCAQAADDNLVAALKPTEAPATKSERKDQSERPVPCSTRCALLDLCEEPPCEVTYGALVRITARLAERICCEAPASSPVVIAVLAAQGRVLVVSMLAVLASGHAFLLLEASLPASRLEYMMQDAAVALVLHPSGSSVPPLAAALPSLAVDVEALLEAKGALGAAPPMAADASIAYVCYTSGSTGRPKGVLVSRGALAAYAASNADEHGIDECSRVLLASSVLFDPSIGEATTALFAGATLCLPARADTLNDLGGVLRRSGATHVCCAPLVCSTAPRRGALETASPCIHAAAPRTQAAAPRHQVCSTPALWSSLAVAGSPLPHLPALRCVCLGGEGMTGALVRRWAAAVPLHNVYGVTECTVYQSSRRVAPEAGEAHGEGGGAGGGEGGCGAAAAAESAATPGGQAAIRAAEREASFIGTPGLRGCKLLLLGPQRETIAPPPLGPHGKHGKLQEDAPPLEGELAICGAQVASGYLNLPELTAERFVRLPSGERAYLTGDLARWEEGGLRLVGRADRQVQLRGLRLELGEVEGVLCGCPLLRRCAVVLIDGVLLAALEPACARLAPPGRDAAADATRAAGCPPTLPSPPSAESPTTGPTVLPPTVLSAACAALVALHASRWLPAAACPRRLDVLEQLPLTPSGKIDRNALTQLLAAHQGGDDGTAAAGAARGAPRGALEELVASTWREVLSVRSVGRGADFLRLGGDSIKALQVAVVVVHRVANSAT